MTLLSFFCSEYIIVFSRQNFKVSEFVENWESTITNTIDFSTVFEILLNNAKRQKDQNEDRCTHQ